MTAIRDSVILSVCVQLVPVWCVCVFTDGAMLAIPALLTLALAISTGAMFHTQRVTEPLITSNTCPALFTVTHTTHTHTVAPAVCRTHLCTHTQQERDGERERRSRSDKKVNLRRNEERAIDGEQTGQGMRGAVRRKCRGPSVIQSVIQRKGDVTQW